MHTKNNKITNVITWLDVHHIVFLNAYFYIDYDILIDLELL